MTFYKKPYFWLTIILLLSAFLRLYHIDGYMEFLGDQGRDVVIVRNFLVNHHFMAIGPQTSIGNMYLGPWYYYLIAPALLVANYNPVGPSILVALFGVATSYLLWVFLSQLLNAKVGLIAAFLFAISPVVIKYTSFSWNPNIMPFFALLFVYAIYQVCFIKKDHYLLLASLSFVFCLNSHYLALLLLPLAGTYLLHYIYQSRPKRRFYRYVLLSVLIFGLSLIPQILFDIKHNGQNIHAIITFFTIRQTTVNLKPYKAIPEMIPLFNQVITRLVASKVDQLGVFVSLILGLSSVFFLKEDKKNRSSILFLWWWLFWGVFGLSLYKQHIYDHYFGFIFPVVFSLVAYVIYKTKYLGYLLFAILVYFSAVNSPLHYPPNNQLATTEKISQFIVNQSNAQPFNLALLAKQNYDPPYRYYIDLQKGQLYTLQDKKTSQLFVICEPSIENCQPLGNPFWDVAAFGIARIDQQWAINNIQIFKLVPNS